LTRLLLLTMGTPPAEQPSLREEPQVVTLQPLHAVYSGSCCATAQTACLQPARHHAGAWPPTVNQQQQSSCTHSSLRVEDKAVIVIFMRRRAAQHRTPGWRWVGSHHLHPSHHLHSSKPSSRQRQLCALLLTQDAGPCKLVIIDRSTKEHAIARSKDGHEQGLQNGVQCLAVCLLKLATHKPA
jgi:hypothetical protein